jgi:hypothetical protein
MKAKVVIAIWCFLSFSFASGDVVLKSYVPNFYNIFLGKQMTPSSILVMGH